MLRLTDKNAAEAKETYKKFSWDEILHYMSLVSGMLALIGLGGEYFTGTDRGLACTVSNTLTRDEARFAVMWCASHMQVRLVDAVPFVMFVQGLFLAGPHLLWETMAAPALEQFFAMAPSLSRSCDCQTGEWPFETVEIVRKLKATYEKSETAVSSYQWKLWVQLIVSLVFLVVLGVIFHFTGFFAVHFLCTKVGEDLTFRRAGFNSTRLTGYNPYDTLCTYTTANSMVVICCADIGVLIIAFIAAVKGVECCKKPHHWTKLDSSSYASFLYAFSMNPTAAAQHCYKPNLQHKKSLRIKTDLDLLVLMLFRKDKGLGETFFDVQVQLQLEKLFQRQLEDLSTYFCLLLGPLSLPLKPTFAQVQEHRLRLIQKTVETAKKGSDFGKDKNRCVLGDKILQLCYDKRRSTFQSQLESNTSVENTLPLYDSGLHLYCGSKGCALSLSQICGEVIPRYTVTLCYSN